MALGWPDGCNLGGTDTHTCWRLAGKFSSVGVGTWGNVFLTDWRELGDVWEWLEWLWRGVGVSGPAGHCEESLCECCWRDARINHPRCAMGSVIFMSIFWH